MAVFEEGYCEMKKKQKPLGKRTALKVGDKVRLDASNATIFVALNWDGSTGTVKRIQKNGRAVVQWRDNFHSATPVRYLEKVKASTPKTPPPPRE